MSELLARRLWTAVRCGDERAVELARRLLERMKTPEWGVINTAINALVTFGKYGEAVALASRWEDSAVAGPRSERVLVRINVSEALYDLGRWQEAWECLEGLDDAAVHATVTRGALLTQRAWIAAHEGRYEEALALARKADPEWFPAEFRSEVFFSRAMALLGLRYVGAAKKDVERGLEVARRASTHRNGAFLLARIAAAAGDAAEAERQFKRAANHRYRGQGGDGLLAWGEFLAANDRRPEALEAWRLATERDPESESAARARARIEEASRI